MRWLIVLIFLTGCMKPTPQETCGFITNRDGQRISWRHLPVVVTLDPSYPKKYDADAVAAAQVWNDSIGRELIRITREPSANAVYYSSVWNGSSKFEQARTSVQWANDRIMQASVWLNARDFTFTPYGERRIRTDMTSILVHEFGHLLGLAHSSESLSVMYPTLMDGLLRHQMTDLDWLHIQCEYF